MEKQHSVKRLFGLSFLLTELLLVIATFAYGLYSIRLYARQILTYNAASLQKYSDSFSEDLNMLREFNHSIVYSNPSFQLLSLGSYADSRRVVQQYYLQQMMLYHTPTYGITMLYDSMQDTAYSVQGSRISADQKRTAQVRGFIHSMVREPENNGFSNYDEWFFASDGRDPYFVIANRLRRSTLFSCFNIQAYIDRTPVPDDSGKGTTLFFSSEEILIGKEFAKEHGIDPDILRTPSRETGEALRFGYFYHTVFLDEYNVGISVVTPFSALIPYMFPQLIFLLFIILAVAAIILIVYRVLSRILVLPLQEIAVMSQQLEDEADVGAQTLPSRRYREFAEIRNALKTLRDNIVALELEKRSKESEKEHALLQYFQLQTRSHFILNCLKSLYSMLQNGEYGRMKNMILGFSSHLRYIFHDNMSVVALESELKEVNDYYRIIQMDSSRILLLQQDVPPGLFSCKVPPLIIQTFLENTYQYNDRMSGTPLAFQIRVSCVRNDEGEYLQIHCSDNGCGYRPEVLEKINGDLSGTFDQYNVGINNLRRRMSIVYRDNYHAAFYNLPAGGACSVIFVPIVR